VRNAVADQWPDASPWMLTGSELTLPIPLALPPTAHQRHWHRVCLD